MPDIFAPIREAIEILIREELPKTMIGKLDRKALRAEEGA